MAVLMLAVVMLVVSDGLRRNGGVHADIVAFFRRQSLVVSKQFIANDRRPTTNDWDDCRVRLVPDELGQQLRRFLGVVSQYHARTGAADRDERFHHHALPVDPLVAGGGFDHRVLA